MCYTCEYVPLDPFMLEKGAEMNARKNQQAKSEIGRGFMLPKLTSKIPIPSTTARAAAAAAASKVSNKKNNLKTSPEESSKAIGLTSEAKFDDNLSTTITFDDIRQLILAIKAQKANVMEGPAANGSSEGKSSTQTSSEDNTSGVISDSTINPATVVTSLPIIEEGDDDDYCNIKSDDEWSVIDEKDISERS